MRNGWKVSEETKRKISLAKKGKPSSWKGKSPSAESREKMRLAKLGKPSAKKGVPITEEQKRKISMTLMGRVQSDEIKEKNRQGQIRRHLRTNPNYLLEGRNARIARNGGFHSQGEWETLKAQYNWTCPCCKKAEPEIKLTKDHIISLLRGGSNNIENIQPLCSSCNSKKYTQTIRY